MTGSAIFGQPPSNSDDYWTIKGLMRLYQIPEGVINPANGFPAQLHAPPDYRFETQGPEMLAGICVALVVVLLITGTRLGLRAGRKDLRWGLDDWVIIPAAIGAVGWLGCVIGMISHGGAGKHLWDVTYREFFWFFRLAGIAELIFWITVGLIKISITLFNRRLTGLTSERWMMAHYTFLFLLVCYIIISLCTNLFGCSPAVSLYNLEAIGKVQKPIKCFDPNTLGIALSTVHVVFDFALLSVPMIVLYKIKMSLEKKIRLGFLFSVGTMSCVGSALRQHYQVQKSADFMWDFPKQMNWTVVDLVFGIIAASLPVLNAAIPKRWRSPSNSIPTPHTFKPFAINTDRGSRRLESDERIHHNQIQGHQGTANNNTSAGEKGSVVPVTLETRPAPELQIPTPTYRDHFKDESMTGDGLV